jgi:hypothetical protein
MTLFSRKSSSNRFNIVSIAASGELMHVSAIPNEETMKAVEKAHPRTTNIKKQGIKTKLRKHRKAGDSGYPKYSSITAKHIHNAMTAKVTLHTTATQKVQFKVVG